MIATHFLSHLFEYALFYWLKLLEITNFICSHFLFNGSLFRFCIFRSILSLANSGVCQKVYHWHYSNLQCFILPLFSYFILLFQNSFLLTLFCII